MRQSSRQAPPLVTRLLGALERARTTGVGLALMLSLLLVAPAFAGAGPTRLFDPFVSDRTVATTSAVTFKVNYRNREGSAADWVRVQIGDTTHAMTRTGGTTGGWASPSRGEARSRSARSGSSSRG